MIDEPFSRGESPIHALDARFRLIACLALSLAAALARSTQPALVVLAVGLACVVAARLPWRLVCGRFVAVNAFVAFLWLVLPWSTPGEPLYVFHGLAVTREGIDLAARITLKTNAILACVLSLLATIPAPDLGAAMAGLGLPDKFTFLFLFTYRYLHVIHEEYGRMATAARLRGFVPATSLHAYRTYAALVAMVLVHSYDRSRRVYEAMVLRGFSGRFRSLARFAPGRADVTFLCCSLAVAALAGALDVLPWSAHG
ncbi:MAG: cobalt ECF transporter T component CbiQ [Solidesulfovibrio sp. DCME]|uniref:cobalt ECF transporter T component CbiQ n=1 Tax=Solidesulfovibrio sp. DCME TaxID=3447380 RepID=UPI003D14A00B